MRTGSVQGAAMGIGSLVLLAAVGCTPEAASGPEERAVRQPLVWAQKQKLVASDGEALEHAGEGVGISGNVAMVGSKQDDDNGVSTGSVYVFTKDALGNWSQTQQLYPTDPKSGDWFGEELSIDGDRAVIDARYSEGPPPYSANTGAAYVFERNASGTWTQVQKIYPATQTSGQFGADVSLEGSRILVGNWSAQLAYVFERDAAGVWTQIQILTKSDGLSDDHFGDAVGVSGDRAIVGAPEHDALGVNSGAAYVYERNVAGTWVQVKKLLASDGGGGDRFGETTEISGNYAIVGAPSHSVVGCGAACGAIYVFERDASGNWLEVQELNVVTPNAGDLGITIALEGGRLVAGHWNESNPPGQGAAYIFDRASTGVWTQTQKVTPLDPVLGHGFSQHSVALSGSLVLAGAIFDDQVANQAGAAYLFEAGPGNGDPCASPSECPSGFCVDGVCCDTACGGGVTTDCQACSVASGAAVNGTCGLFPSSVECRASAGVCDVAESCSGTSGACPPDAFENSSKTCRPAASACDAEEHCDGAGASCPPDGFLPDGTACTDGTCQSGACEPSASGGAAGQAGSGGSGGVSTGGSGGVSTGGSGGVSTGGSAGVSSGGSAGGGGDDGDDGCSCAQVGAASTDRWQLLLGPLGLALGVWLRRRGSRRLRA